MIWSVSMLSSFKGAIRDEKFLNLGSAIWLFVNRYCARVRAYVLDVSLDGGERGHRGGHQEGARALSLPADEIAVGRGRAIFSGGSRVAVHRDAHGATGFPPLASRGEEYFVEAFGFRRVFDLL